MATLATAIPEGSQVQGGWEAPTLSSATAGRQTLHACGPPGRHVLRWQGVWIKTRPITIDGQVVQVLENFGFVSETATVTIGKGDDPDPPPPPPPTQRWALIVEESGQRTPAQSSLYVKLRDEYQGRLLIADKDSTAPTLQLWLRQVPDGTSLPVLVVASVDGVLVRVVPLPATVEAFKHEMTR